jgi:hypothetical protein
MPKREKSTGRWDDAPARSAPPLCITKDELDWAIGRLQKVLTS